MPVTNQPYRRSYNEYHQNEYKKIAPRSYSIFDILSTHFLPSTYYILFDITRINNKCMIQRVYNILASIIFEIVLFLSNNARYMKKHCKKKNLNITNARSNTS